MIGHGANFGRKKEAAIAALLTARNTEEAARSIGIGPATLRRWQKEPEFDAAFREAQRLSYKQSTARMHQACSAAVSVLHKVMVDPATPPATKVRAADACSPTPGGTAPRLRSLLRTAIRSTPIR